jgi:hypothetical protein
VTVTFSNRHAEPLSPRKLAVDGQDRGVEGLCDDDVAGVVDGYVGPERLRVPDDRPQPNAPDGPGFQDAQPLASGLRR